MLQCTELVRDVLCREVIAASNAVKANVMCDAMSHLRNMADILMSDKDFEQVEPCDAMSKKEPHAQKRILYP